MAFADLIGSHDVLENYKFARIFNPGLLTTTLMCCSSCCLEPDGPIDETVIQELSSRRLHLHREANELCSIAKLPADVLIEIFQVTGKPLLFGGICKDWRQIAWASPLLWSTVSVKVSKRPSQVDLLREWLLRAQSAPLSIYLTLDMGCERTSDPFRAVFELLVTRAEYWKIFDCVLPTPVDRCPDMLQRPEFPSLTSLSLQSSGSYSPFPTMFLVAPWLERVKFSVYDLSECTLEGFPLEQLRCFKMEHSNITDVQSLALLCRAQALQECYFDELVIKDSMPPPFPTLHTQLELLYVVNPSHFFLDNLILPKLRVLTVNDTLGIVGDPLCAAISSLVSRSSHHLERLNLTYDRPFKDDIVITLLEALPSLTHLDLASFHEPKPSVGLTDKLISRLRPLDHATCLLPRLTSFKYRGTISCNHRLLVDMLSERWHRSSGSEGGQGVSCLIRANIIAFPRSHRGLGNVCADINMLIDEGMEVEIRL